MNMNERFRKFSHETSAIVGSSWSFMTALLIILIWAVTGPMFHFSDTWQLIINTGTTIVTFLMVFLIQNTQNRDAMAIHLKLDELIRAVKGARNQLVNLEQLSDDDLKNIASEFEHVRKKAEYAEQKASTAHEKVEDVAEKVETTASR